MKNRKMGRKRNRKIFVSPAFHPCASIHAVHRAAESYKNACCKWEKNLERNSRILEMDYKSESQQRAQWPRRHRISMTGNPEPPDTGETDTEQSMASVQLSTYRFNIMYFSFHTFAGIEAIAIGIANTHSFHSPVDRPAFASVGRPASQPAQMDIRKEIVFEM